MTTEQTTTQPVCVAAAWLSPIDTTRPPSIVQLLDGVNAGLRRLDALGIAVEAMEEADADAGLGGIIRETIIELREFAEAWETALAATGGDA